MDLGWLVVRSGFVPEDRRGIFKRGLEAGLRGDLAGALHFLIPQVENSLRHLLVQAGEIATRLDTDDTEDEHLLGRVLDSPKLVDLLGEDLVFDIRGLLNERAGANLRNELAHGMVSDVRLLQSDCLYVWWLVLRLCVQHFKVPEKAQADDASEEP